MGVGGVCRVDYVLPFLNLTEVTNISLRGAKDPNFHIQFQTTQELSGLLIDTLPYRPMDDSFRNLPALYNKHGYG